MNADFQHDGSGTSAQDWRADPRWAALPTYDPEVHDRVVVLAAHPDDESLGAAGLVSRAVRVGLPVSLVVATAGEHSHPGSPTRSSAELAALREGESREAWRALGATGDPLFLGVEDGTLAGAAEAVTTALVDLLGDARGALLLAPWRHDAHPDHEAAGRAAAAAARRTGAALLEYPVWFWHWGRPEQAPWAEAVTVPLREEDEVRKRRAIACHRTQVAPLSAQPGDEVLLPAPLLAHFGGASEVFLVAPARDDALDLLHAGTEEPWGADRRWYEQRKRDLALACLPARRYGRALEVGCSTGVLSAQLAGRCEELVAVDASGAALHRARRRLEDLDAPAARVRTEQLQVPQEWPAGDFDLVVVSEVGYFLSPVDLERLAARVRGSLVTRGCVLLCHWRHPVAGWVLDGPEVHRRLTAALGLAVLARYDDADVEILVLGTDGDLPDPLT